MIRRALSICLFACSGSLSLAQWNPAAGQWGRTDSRDLRVMQWNIQDAICRTQPKVEGSNSWCALAHIVAALKPDVLVIEEAGDNAGNGTGTGVDSQAQLTSVIQMFVGGGTDTFLGGSVTSYVQKYDATLSYPYIYVSNQTDNFNRNCIISRYPFADLNGDGQSNLGNIVNASDLYAPGGGGGIRGFAFSEIDLPDDKYRGNLVMGYAHLKSGSAASDLADRLTAAKNVAYIIDYLFNGGGTNTPNPRGRIITGATTVLDPYTPVIWAGDFNEDENTNGRDGPALWLTRAEIAGGTDGTDRDRSDSMYDDARDPFNNARNTQGSSKLDYICWQDSIATLRRSFIFNSASIGSSPVPSELSSFGTVAIMTSLAADHRPVIADFILPAPPPPAPGAFSLSLPSNGDASLDLSPTLSWGTSSGATTYTVKVSTNASLAPAVFSQSGIGATSLGIPAGTLAGCTTYYWGVTAVNANGSTASSPASFSFSTRSIADFNGDGFLDFTDFDAFVAGFEAGDEAADFNADGFIDFTDFDGFVSAFEAGC